MRLYTEFVDRYRKVFYIILGLLIILAGAGIRRLDINPDFEMFMPRESEYEEVLSRYRPGNRCSVFDAGFKSGYDCQPEQYFAGGHCVDFWLTVNFTAEN